LLPIVNGGFKTVDEYLEAAKGKNEGIIYYATDKVAQAQYIAMLGSQDIDVVLLDKMIDTQFISTVENADGAADKKIKFMRVDSDVAGALKGDGDILENAPLADLFKKVSGEEKLEVKFEALKDTRVPALLTVSEQSRRMEDMMKMYRMNGGDKDSFKMPLEATLVLNSGNPLIRKLCDKTEAEGTEAAVRQIYKLALLSQRKLTADELQAFLYDSFSILERTI
jgi:molecular chaperone HtpG